MISVVIPVYRVEKYVNGCIKSVIRQSEKDFELIVVDDGSPDGSIAIAEKLLAESGMKNYQVIHTENRGVSAARNTGIQNAKGEFVIMVDSDDVLSSCFLEDMVRMAEEIPDCDIYSSGFSVVDEKNAEVFHAYEKSPKSRKYTAQEAVAAYQSRKIKFLLPTLMIRKNFLETCRILFDEKVRYSEDVQFIWRCLFYNKKPVVHSEKQNYNYILHGNSTMTSSGVDKIITGFVGLDALHIEVRGMVNDSLIDKIVCQMYFSLLHGAAKMLAFEDFKTLYERTECGMKLQKRKDGDYRYRCVTAILKTNLKIGYLIMRTL